jgi:hypothetical protein
MTMKTELEIRAYRDALQKYQGCSAVDVNLHRSGILEAIKWVLQKSLDSKTGRWVIKTDLELRAYRDALLKYKDRCSVVEKNQYLYGEIESLDWMLGEKITKILVNDNDDNQNENK